MNFISFSHPLSMVVIHVRFYLFIIFAITNNTTINILVPRFLSTVYTFEDRFSEVNS